MADRGKAYNRQSSDGVAALETPHDATEEELYLQEAIKNSLKEADPPEKSEETKDAPEQATEQTPAATQEDDLLLDLFGAPAPAPAPAPVTAPAPAPAAAAVPNAYSQQMYNQSLTTTQQPAAYAGYAPAPAPVPAYPPA